MSGVQPDPLAPLQPQQLPSVSNKENDPLSSAEARTDGIAQGVKRSRLEGDRDVPPAKEMKMSSGVDPAQTVGRAGDILNASELVVPSVRKALLTREETFYQPLPMDPKVRQALEDARKGIDATANAGTEELDLIGEEVSPASRKGSLEREDTFYEPLGLTLEIKQALQEVRSEASDTLAGSEGFLPEVPLRSDKGPQYVSNPSLRELIVRLKDFVKFKLNFGEEAKQLEKLEIDLNNTNHNADTLRKEPVHGEAAAIAGGSMKDILTNIERLEGQYKTGVVVQEEVKGLIQLMFTKLFGDDQAKRKEISEDLQRCEDQLNRIAPHMQEGFRAEINELRNASSRALSLPLTERKEVMDRLKTIEGQVTQLEQMIHYEAAYVLLQNELAELEHVAPPGIAALTFAAAQVKEINTGEDQTIGRLTEDALVQIRRDLNKTREIMQQVSKGVVSASFPATATNRALLTDFEKQVVKVVSVQFPTLPLTRGNAIGEGKKSDFNNYALKADPDSIVIDPEKGRLISFQIGERLVKNTNPQAVVDGLNIYTGKGDSLYHDATRLNVTTGGARILTVCDGSGHRMEAKKVAEIAAEQSERYLMENVDQATTLPDQVKAQLRAFKSAHDSLAASRDNLEKDAQTTFIQCVVRGDVLSGVSLGDSKAFVFRQKLEGGWECIDATNYYKGQFATAYSGGALSGNDADPSDVGKMRAFAMGLQKGDVVYLASDGVVDGFDPVSTDRKNGRGEEWDDRATNPHLQEDIEYADQQTARRMEAVVSKAKNGMEIQQFIDWHLRDATQERKIKMYEDASYRAQDRDGAKMDDAGSVFFEFKGIGG